ncbi:hypothetical protein E4A47_09185 [Micrococcus flavus]|uniref:Uncharacterized protein n=1 Tax=Micrococcus flavus TaxID=384602 RepID=A0A4Y8WXY7_9MICC|nr:hypothetical protein [Micrococcus flavus]MBB4883813.1 hypothetical protein [Micrococcus flavus]TFI00301.1 hypothetical protein E4A47_09185 [Micrococcus flavus]GGK47393.1 hypothetical protein GCM10007073_13110 [Micrococcus flavus]
MLKTISSLGIKSDYMFAAGLASVGLTWVAWAVSRFGADESKPQADRWGLFTGEWAPTFIALGTALKLEEQESRSLTK